MKKLVLLLGIILYLVSCKVEEPKFANQSTFLEAETTTIEHVSIPLTNSQLLELFRNMSPLAQTRVAVFNLLTEGEVEFWSTEGPGVLVMYFTAPWNGPCKRYRLIFEKVANDYTNKECHFGRIDIDQAGEDIATKYGVNTLPTTLIIKNNKKTVKLNIKPAEYGEKIKLALYIKERRLEKIVAITMMKCGTATELRKA